MPQQKVKITKGQKFGDWVTQHEVSERDKSGRIYWQVQCKCGRTNKVRATDLHRHATKQCPVCSGIAVRLKPFQGIFNGLLRSAIERNIPVEITLEDYTHIATTERQCHYCHTPLKWSVYTSKYGKNGYQIDRKEFTKGYTLDNVVACCKRCNRGKMNLWSYEEWRLMTKCFRERVDE